MMQIAKCHQADVGSIITGHGSTLYIGIAMFLYFPHTFGNSFLAFSFKLI